MSRGQNHLPTIRDEQSTSRQGGGRGAPGDDDAACATDMKEALRLIGHFRRFDRPICPVQLPSVIAARSLLC